MDIKWIPPLNGIYKIKQPLFPQYHFEWHSQTGKVYVINLSKTIKRNGEDAHEANVLAEHCTDHGTAFNFVQTWLRGYREGLSTPNNSNKELVYG